jgi:hypothetical protein
VVAKDPADPQPALLDALENFDIMDDFQEKYLKALRTLDNIIGKIGDVWTLLSI